jgi:HPt (histidine-containing phosphotransfer) domain-containing protein
LYATILQSYLDELPDQPAQLDSLFARGDLVAAGRMRHTLKGVSATVGAVYLRAVAAAAEADVKRGLNATQRADLSTRFSEAVAVTLRTMAPMVRRFAEQAQATANSDTQNDAPDHQALLADLGELQSLLIRSDLKALDVHARVQAASAASGTKGFAELEQSVKNFDFAKAAAQCERLLLALQPPQQTG